MHKQLIVARRGRGMMCEGNILLNTVVYECDENNKKKKNKVFSSFNSLSDNMDLVIPSGN